MYVGVAIDPVMADRLVMSLLAPKTAADKFSLAFAASDAPVPPCATPTSEPSQTPVPMVPSVVMLVCPGHVVEMRRPLLLASRLVPFSLTENALEMSCSPLPAVYVPAPENCVQGILVTPIVPVDPAVVTQPVAKSVAPSSINVNAPGTSAQLFMSVVRVQPLDAAA